MPPRLGGDGNGTNPEQLFAAGYSSCFHNALVLVGRRAGFDLTGSTVAAKVGIGPNKQQRLRPRGRPQRLAARCSTRTSPPSWWTRRTRSARTRTRPAATSTSRSCWAETARTADERRDRQAAAVPGVVRTDVHVAGDARRVTDRERDVDVHGTVAEGFEPVRDAFVRNFEPLGERGAAVAVYRDGRKVVDLWAGTRDVDGARALGPGHRPDRPLGDQGRRRRRAAAAAPARGAGPGRAGRHVLAGVQGGRQGTVARAAAARAPRRAARPRPARSPPPRPPTRDRAGRASPRSAPPGSPAPTTATTRRPTAGCSANWSGGSPAGPSAAGSPRRSPRPLGLDFWIGLPQDGGARGWAASGRSTSRARRTAAACGLRPKRAVAEAYADPDSLTRRAFAAITPLPDENDPAYRAAALPASNGIATARRPRPLLRGARSARSTADRGCSPRPPLTLARTEESAGPDRVLVVNTRFGLGYMLHGPASPLLGPGSFGHPGRGGSLGFADPESGIALRLRHQRLPQEGDGGPAGPGAGQGGAGGASLEGAPRPPGARPAT